MNEDQVKEIKEALRRSWSERSCMIFEEEYPYYGQCAQTSIVILEKFGGEILRTRGWPKNGKNGQHFYNRINGVRHDFTAEQFSEIPGYTYNLEYDDILSSVEEAATEAFPEQISALRDAFNNEYSSIGTETDNHTPTVLASMDQVLKPQRQLQEQIYKILEPQIRLQEEMEKYLEPQRILKDEIQKYLEPHRQVQEHWRKHIEPELHLLKELERYIEPQRKLQEQMEKYFESHRRLQEQFKKYLEPHRLLQDEISKYLQPLNRYLSESLMESVSVGSDGLLSVSGEVVDVESINRSLDCFADEYSDSEDFFQKFFQSFEKLPYIVRVAVLYFILEFLQPYIISIIANLTTPIYEEWWAETADIDQRATKKEIIREANELFQSSLLKDYRFVHANVLHVRETGSMNSEITDELYRGKTVRLIEKSKSWSEVQYHDSDTNVLMQGWVFSRYLHKFVK